MPNIDAGSNPALFTKTNSMGYRTLRPEKIVPEFGNIKQILLVRKYDRILRGEEPVKRLTGWETDDELKVVSCLIECPDCFHEHRVYTDNETGEFDYDSNFCHVCQQEFCFHDDNEFELYVNTEQQ